MIADVGLHTAESLVLTVGLADAIRSPLGRFRPRESPDDAFHFKAGEGFTEFSARSYPSIHAAAAFATASSLVGEIRVRNPSAVKYAAPLLYTVALVPGFTRMYLNQHWASDVVAGTLMGALLGSRVVSYAHSHRRSRLDAALLGATIVPDGRGGLMVGMSLAR
jgi:membrane-associated phospholipid phosphatase